MCTLMKPSSLSKLGLKIPISKLGQNSLGFNSKMAQPFSSLNLPDFAHSRISISTIHKINSNITFYSAQLPANSPCEDKLAYFTKGSKHYFGIFDGHGGPEVSAYLQKHLLPACAQHSFKKAFKQVDEHITGSKKTKPSLDPPSVAYCGSCALVTEINADNNKFSIAWCGDSRAVHGKYDETRWVATQLSTDHVCDNTAEIARLAKINKSYAIINDRILGVYQPTRSFGDGIAKWDIPAMIKYFKPQGLRVPKYATSPPYLTSKPEVNNFKLKKNEFIVMASDGLFEFLNNLEVVEYVGEWISSGLKGNISELLICYALEKTQQLKPEFFELDAKIIRTLRDDMSVYVVMCL